MTSLHRRSTGVTVKSIKFVKLKVVKQCQFQKNKIVEAHSLITGIFLQVLWLIMLLKRPMPDKQGIATSVKTRSM
jgi:hypothetical protein